MSPGSYSTFILCYWHRIYSTHHLSKKSCLLSFVPFCIPALQAVFNSSIFSTQSAPQLVIKVLGTCTIAYGETRSFLDTDSLRACEGPGVKVFQCLCLVAFSFDATSGNLMRITKFLDTLCSAQRRCKSTTETGSRQVCAKSGCVQKNESGSLVLPLWALMLYAQSRVPGQKTCPRERCNHFVLS